MNAPRPAAMLFLRSLIVALMFGGAVASVQAEPVVSNLTAAKRAGTKLVDITYDLNAARFSKATWTFPVTGAKQGIRAKACSVTGRTIACNGAMGRPRSFSTHMRFQVKIDAASPRSRASHRSITNAVSQGGGKSQPPEYQFRDTQAPFLRRLTYPKLFFCGKLDLKPRLTHSI